MLWNLRNVNKHWKKTGKTVYTYIYIYIYWDVKKFGTGKSGC